MAGQYDYVPMSWDVSMIAPPFEMEFAVEGNPVKRGLVRQLQSEVAVRSYLAIQRYTRGSGRSRVFEAITCSARDRARADFYRSNAPHAALQSEMGDVGACLASLGMQWRLVTEATATRPIIPMKVVRANFATAQVEFPE